MGEGVYHIPLKEDWKEAAEFNLKNPVSWAIWNLDWFLSPPLPNVILESSVTYLVVGKIIDHIWASQVTLVIKNLLKNAIDIRDAYLIPWLGRSPGGRKVNPLQYSCLENPTDRGSWRATVHRVSKSGTRLKWLSMHAIAPIYGGVLHCQVIISVLDIFGNSVGLDGGDRGTERLSIFPRLQS